MSEALDRACDRLRRAVGVDCAEADTDVRVPLNRFEQLEREALNGAMGRGMLAALGDLRDATPSPQVGACPVCKRTKLYRSTAVMLDRGAMHASPGDPIKWEHRELVHCHECCMSLDGQALAEMNRLSALLEEAQKRARR